MLHPVLHPSVHALDHHIDSAFGTSTTRDATRYSALLRADCSEGNICVLTLDLACRKSAIHVRLRHAHNQRAHWASSSGLGFSCRIGLRASSRNCICARVVRNASAVAADCAQATARPPRLRAGHVPTGHVPTLGATLGAPRATVRSSTRGLSPVSPVRCSASRLTLRPSLQ